MEHAYVDELPSDEESCYYAEHLVFHPDPDPAVPPAYTDDELAAVLPYCPHISAAYLSGIPDLSSRTLILLAEHASGLAYLDVSGCAQLTDLGLQAVAAHSTALAALCVSRIPSLTDHGLAALVRGLPHLEELEMDSLPLVTALSTRDVWTFARGLKRWTLSGCMHVTDAGFPWVPECAQLAEDPERRRTWMESLPPLVLPASHKLNNLRVLDLSHCVRLTDAAVLGVVAHAPRIHNLNLAGCIELTDRAMRAVCSLGRHLGTIDVGGLERVTDEGVFAVASECTRLRSVDISCESCTSLRSRLGWCMEGASLRVRLTDRPSGFSDKSRWTVCDVRILASWTAHRFATILYMHGYPTRTESWQPRVLYAMPQIATHASVRST